MNNNVFVRKEFIQKVDISEQVLEEWEKNNLIKPVGYTDEQVPFYLESTIVRVNHIKQLMDLGYGLDEIQKIIKKVGLPKSSDTKDNQKKQDQYLTIGNLAERVGVSPRTIKHWEDKKIIEPDMRSEGGFRLYSEIYIYLCNLIKDLQLFGYTLEEIKTISDYFRDFIAIQNNPDIYSQEIISQKLDDMSDAIHVFFKKIEEFKEGIQRWEDLLRKKKKEIALLKTQNQKRSEKSKKE